jgi:hypothetical protein
MIDETTPAASIPVDHLAYAALHRETQGLIKTLKSGLDSHVKDEANAFHDVTGINVRLDKGQARMDSIEKSIGDNHNETILHRKHLEDLLQKNTTVTDEIREILEGGKSFFRAIAKVGSWTRTVILWFLPVITAVLSFWYVITDKYK